jgi:type II secretory pathway component PulF
MPSFTYSAVDPAGSRRQGVAEWTNRAAATAALRGEGLLVLDLREAESAIDDATARDRRATRGDLLDLTRTLAALLPAGLPLPRALDASRRMARGGYASVLGEVRQKIERGERLAVALAAHPSLFPAHYIGLVRAGERTGDLAGAFARLTEQLEREAQIRSRLLSATLYPLILAVAGGSAMLVLLTVVLPNFAALLQDTGTALPTTTVVVLGLGAALRRFWFVLPAIAVVATLTLVRLRAHPAGRLALARFADGMPLLGPLLREIAAARFARVTGTLLAGGAPLLSALDDATVATTSPLAHEAAGRVRVAVREGAALHRAMQREPAFPPLLVQLAALGEESARLDEFLLKAAVLFEERTERLVQRLVTLAEPTMIVAFGGVIGFVALSLLQAIYSVNAGAFR